MTTTQIVILTIIVLMVLVPIIYEMARNNRLFLGISIIGTIVLIMLSISGVIILNRDAKLYKCPEYKVVEETIYKRVN